MKKEIEIEIVKLEDKREYVVLEALEINGIKYLFLGLLEEVGMDIKVPTLVIRKLDQKEKNIIGLESEEEYNNVLNIFAKEVF